MSEFKGSYKSIKGQGEGIFKDRGSKFLSFAIPVQDEEEIAIQLEQLRRSYHDARHHCYAWRLGPTGDRSRANDDGEPSNSAGKPILNQIEKRDLTNTLVVVVRYFGGTLLGVGGLINAYRTAAEEALNSCKIEKKFVYRILQAEFEYPLMNKVMQLIKNFKMESYDQCFELNCSLKMKVKLDKEDTVREALTNIQGLRIKDLGTE